VLILIEEAFMARYVTKVRTALAPAEAFAYMADLRNFAAWDPGVKKVAQVDGDGAGPAASFDVTVSGTTLRYVTNEYHSPRNLLVVAESATLVSTDRVTIEPVEGGSVVTYDADLRLKGVFRLAEPVLKLAFGRIGDRAAAGLRTALAGTKVE
jgi:carbon monoxide dehydrogenase subunit G